MLASPTGSALVSHQISSRFLPVSFPHWYNTKKGLSLIVSQVLLVLSIVLSSHCAYQNYPVEPLPEDRVFLKEGVKTLLREGDYVELEYVERQFIQIERITTDQMEVRVLGEEPESIIIPEQGYAPNLALRMVRLRDGEAVVVMQHDILL